MFLLPADSADSADRADVVYTETRQQWSLLNRFRTEQGHCGACRTYYLDAAEGNGDLQTLICVLVARPRRDPDDVSHCRILSPDKTEWWLISATLCR